MGCARVSRNNERRHDGPLGGATCVSTAPLQHEWRRPLQLPRRFSARCVQLPLLAEINHNFLGTSCGRCLTAGAHRSSTPRRTTPPSSSSAAPACPRVARPRLGCAQRPRPSSRPGNSAPARPFPSSPAHIPPCAALLACLRLAPPVRAKSPPHASPPCDPPACCLAHAPCSACDARACVASLCDLRPLCVSESSTWHSSQGLLCMQHPFAWPCSSIQRSDGRRGKWPLLLRSLLCSVRQPSPI